MSIVVRFNPTALTAETYDGRSSGSPRTATSLRLGWTTTSASGPMGTCA